MPTEDTPKTTGLSPTDRAYLQQQAVNDFSRTIGEIQNIYFSHLRELSSSGAMGQSGMIGMQNLATSNQMAMGAQLGVTGLALGATFLGSPLMGAAIAGTGAFLTNHYLGNQQVQATQAAQMGQAQMLSGQISMMGAGNAGSIYNQFMSGLDPTRYGVGVERLAAFDALNQGAAGFGMGNFNRLLDLTTNQFNPEGNLQAVMRMGQGSRTIAGLTINSLGMSSEDYVSRAVVGYRQPAETDAELASRFPAILKSMTRKEKEELYGEIEHEETQHRFGRNAGSDQTWKALTAARVKALTKMGYRAEGFEIPDGSRMTTDILVGGEAAAEAYRQRFGSLPAMDSLINIAMGGSYRSMRFAENLSQQQDILSGDLLQQGDVFGAIGARMESGSGISTQLNILRKHAFNPDGSIKSPEAAMRYRQLSSAYTSTQSDISNMTMSASSPMIAGLMGAGQVGFALGSFGNTGAIMGGLGATLAAGEADISRIQNRLSAGNLTPDQQAALQERLFAAITRNIEAFDRATSSVMQMGQAAAQTGTASATGAFQRGVAGGAAGAGFHQLSGGVSSAMGNQMALLDSQMQQREAMVLQMGGDPSQDMTLNRMRQQREGLATQSFLFERETAIAPLEVGTRRAMSRTDFHLDILNTLPGAVGAMRKELELGIGNTGRAYREMEANRATRIGEGKWLEVDQERFEQAAFDLKRKEAGYRSQLMEGFESRLVSTVINGTANMDFVAPEMAYRVAVGGGLKGARFGANREMQGEYMRDAHALIVHQGRD